MRFTRLALMAPLPHNKAVVEAFCAVSLYLHKQCCLGTLSELVIEEETARALLRLGGQQRFVNGLLDRRVAASALASHADLLVVVGGDGSLLQAARVAAPQGLPVLGINKGRLGFLADISPDHIEEIDAILQGEYLLEKRALLVGKAYAKAALIAQEMALNDMVLDRQARVKMGEFDIFINDNFICRQRADGLIVSTPTGSTAYALSGGGPIVHPSLSVLTLVPMFPHTLSSRPIVIDANSEICLCVPDNLHQSPFKLSFDGQSSINLPLGSRVYVTALTHTLSLIHPKHYHYFTTLRKKLHWAPDSSQTIKKNHSQ